MLSQKAILALFTALLSLSASNLHAGLADNAVWVETFDGAIAYTIEPGIVSASEFLNMVTRKQKLDAAGFELFFKGQRLEGGKLLAEYGINLKSTVYLVAKKTETKPVFFVKTLPGKLMEFSGLSPQTTVLGLKAAIGRSTGTPVKHFILIHAGKELQDGRTLADYGIDFGFTVHMLLNLSGS